MHTIYLSTDEQTLFATLPSDIRAEWSPATEVLTYDDSPDLLKTRCDNMRLDDPSLQTFQKSMASAETDDDVIALIQKIDFDAIPDRDAGEIFFAMGPGLMSLCIAQMLSSPMTREQMQSLADFCAVRHELLVSLQPS